MWTARRILKELADADRRRAILTHFWKHADLQHRMVVQMHLARALNFREETIRKMPPEKKADLLAQRMGAPEFEQFIEMALMQYHTHEKNGMMAAFLDQWHVPHSDGSIETEGVDTLTLAEGSTDADTLTEVEMSSDDELMELEDSSMGSVETSPEAADCSTWPRSSPSGYWAVWTLKYHWPPSSSASCASVRVAVPEIGLASEPSTGTTGGAFSPGAAGPWK